MRELCAQHQKLSDPFGPYFRGVHLAICLKSSAASQQPNPFHVLGSIDGLATGDKEILEMEVDQPRSLLHTLNEAASLNELPALPVQHRGISHTLKKQRMFQNHRQQLIGLAAEHLRRSGPL